jgi:hypothetical protein
MRFPCRLVETVPRIFDRFLESLFHIIVCEECAHSAVHEAWSSSPRESARPDLSHNVGHMLYLRFTASDNEVVEGCSFGRRLAVGVLDLGSCLFWTLGLIGIGMLNINRTLLDSGSPFPYRSRGPCILERRRLRQETVSIRRQFGGDPPW